MAEMFPPAGLVIRCGEVELRWLSDDDLPELIEVALRGVHGDELMPFMNDWATVPHDVLPANTLRFYWGERAACMPEDWNVNFGTWHRGRLVGMQSLQGKAFSMMRVASTGSWVGLEHQGQGIGTLMRQMVCGLAIDQLGAVECRSGAFTDNTRSLGVSRRIGYRVVDTTRERRNDAQGWQTHHVLVLSADDFVRPDEPISYEGVDAFRAWIGL
ncbi:GNAT family N-acetyltransferase [Aestuariimicrobium ganziense]|uniref:GNAT family N-acetyltransferase n=1 Tax=Aestuariimicrobium ganziense TaxID=2773677 RepID=UPI001F2F1355|nr:GNAT family N-acetyltransferase [Aestuariimicrobium ganziense]